MSSDSSSSDECDISSSSSESGSSTNGSGGYTSSTPDSSNVQGVNMNIPPGNIRIGNMNITPGNIRIDNMNITPGNICIGNMNITPGNIHVGDMNVSTSNYISSTSDAGDVSFNISTAPGTYNSSRIQGINFTSVSSSINGANITSGSSNTRGVNITSGSGNYNSREARSSNFYRLGTSGSSNCVQNVGSHSVSTITSTNANGIVVSVNGRTWRVQTNGYLEISNMVIGNRRRVQAFIGNASGVTVTRNEAKNEMRIEIRYSNRSNKWMTLKVDAPGKVEELKVTRRGTELYIEEQLSGTGVKVQ